MRDFPLSLDEYQRRAMHTAKKFPDTETELSYGVIGLAGEVGEVAERIKKAVYHDKGFGIEVIDELGDVLWYVAFLCKAYGVNLQDVAESNLAKLHARHGAAYNQQHYTRGQE